MTLIENKIEMTHAIHQSESPMSGAMSIRVSHFDVVAILGRSDEVRLDFQVIGVGGETVAGIYATEICDMIHTLPGIVFQFGKKRIHTVRLFFYYHFHSEECLFHLRK